eukprot:753201-Hanusia_phi.AAC.2
MMGRSAGPPAGRAAPVARTSATRPRPARCRRAAQHAVRRRPGPGAARLGEEADHAALLRRMQRGGREGSKGGNAGRKDRDGAGRGRTGNGGRVGEVMGDSKLAGKSPAKVRELGKSGAGNAGGESPMGEKDRRGFWELTPNDKEQGAKRKRRSHTPKEDTSFHGTTFLRVEMFAEARDREIRDAMTCLPACSSRHDRHGNKASIGGSDVRMTLRRRATSHRRYKFPLHVRLRPKKRLKMANSSSGKAPPMYRAQKRYERNFNSSFEDTEMSMEVGTKGQLLLAV